MGLTGPAIQAAGIVWEVLHLYISHAGGGLSPRHLIFDPAMLLVLVGLLVSIVCVPAAIEVAQARPEELALRQLGAEEEPGTRAARRTARGWSR